MKQFFILSLEDDLKGKGESTKVSTKVNGSTNSLFSIKSIGEADIRTVYYNVASLQQKHCPMLSDMSVVAWLLLSDQSHLNISFWFTWLNMVVIKPGHRINNHGFACLWLQKRHYGNVGLFSVFCCWWCFFFDFEKEFSTDGSSYSHNHLLLWSVCYQARRVCRGERKAEKCFFLHHPWQQVSMHFIFVNAFFKLHKSLCLWPWKTECKCKSVDVYTSGNIWILCQRQNFPKGMWTLL